MLMNNKKIALLTGANSQDSSFLAEFLIEKGYEVHGTVRRSSVPESQTSRIQNIFDKGLIKLHYMDLTDPISIDSVISKIQPDELYHLAAQSHVQISFELPKYTLDTNAGGTLSVLEAVRKFSPHTKTYIASTSEMFGNNIDSDGFQRETTPMIPVSPYGCSKLYAHNICHNYRNSYNMFICSGVLFNHECVSEKTTVIVRNKSNGIISIKRLCDIKKALKKGKNKQQWIISDLEVWDGNDFVDLRCITVTRRPKKEKDFQCRIINTRHGIVETTNHHNLLDNNSKKIKNRDIKKGTNLLHKNFPTNTNKCVVSEDEALFLGIMTGDGYVNNRKARIINNNKDILKTTALLWIRVSGGSVSKTHSYKGVGNYGTTTYIDLNGNSNYSKLLRNEIYSIDGFKKIPDRILNSSQEIQKKFLEGYNLADGLKKNSCTYKFKNFKTNSVLLAHGLLFLVKNCLSTQDYNITFEEDEKYYGYYSINLLTPNYNADFKIQKIQKIKEAVLAGHKRDDIGKELKTTKSTIRKILNNEEVFKKHPLLKNKEEVKKIVCHRDQPEWVCDIETSSGKFMAGVGNIVISNSPRRGINFVTNKVVLEAVKIKLGLSSELTLGNLQSKRDWGHAKDFTKGMFLMLQQPKPNDYVLATGINHSVQELVEYVFGKLDLNWKKYVKTDKKYERPEELWVLKGDSSKAQNELGWTFEYTFESMMDEMIQHWMEKLKK